MDDPLDDMIHLRMAGYYTAGVDPDEDCVHIAESAIQPQSPAANRWGHAHGLSEYARLDAENERLALALAEYTARAERTIAAQQEEIVRLRLANGRKDTEHVLRTTA